MKKATVFLAVLSLLFSLTACASQTESSVSASYAETSNSAEDAEDAISTEAETEEDVGTGTEAENVSFEELTVVDNEQCVIKITGIDPDNIWGYTLTAYLENKSADTTYMFSVDSASVNGVQVDPFWAAEVAAGKKSNEEISFMDSTLSDNGIEEFTDIELSFRVYDSDDWSADAVAEETVHIYPLGEENATTFARESQPSDTVLVDNDSATVIVTGYEEDDIWGYTVNLYLVNKTGDNLTFSVDEASVNGFMADPFWATSVSAGTVAFSSMSWSTSDLEANGIETVDEIEMAFTIYNSDDWSADNLFSETVTLNP